ncbi:DUF4430 domain-containing protein [Geosporobacter ferrireducens]|uniref:Transcobalamin-like C-terminal domain-containing protein n=1 Tax=Geosporobacter ferrireducens TaxID=1424294 RepID=A0A1D8GGC6_9FIRM|nr:DUF4430 domain-containing protein [Geosporobacter ferrireducens]AOT69933.1 hypothetical protein Gferi_10265 [Geosporobacter ferrireducens]
MKKARIFSFLLILVILLGGCSQPENQETGTVEIIITRDFGKEKLHSKTVNLDKDTTVMDVMEKYFDIETAYGGGFVNGINGLKSGFTDKKNRQKMDWFYYVNGLLAQIGANDYDLLPGDIVIWDYHDWSSDAFMSSIIGAYPNNFVNGFAGNILQTEIQYALEYEEQAKKIDVFLKEQGAHTQIMAGIEAHLEDENKHTIVIGPWEQMIKNDFIKDIYQNKSKAGLYFEIDRKIKALSFTGESAGEYEKAAVIVSVPKHYGSTASLWMITGNDENCIQKAAKILYENPESINGMYSLIVTEENLVSIPRTN